MTLSAWWNVLVRNRFAIPLSGFPMAAFISLFAMANTVLGFGQKIIYGSRIRRVELVAPPVFVIGHWRSGTTLLHELLAADPRHTSPNTFTSNGCNHFLISESWLKHLIFSWMRPTQRPMDNMKIDWQSPQEDEWALCNLGMPSPYLTCLFPNRPPQAPEYLDLKSLSPTKRQRWKDALYWYLKCLTIRERKRIVLKTPLHTARLAILLEMFPDARFIHIVRDPFVLYPSTVQMWRRVYSFQGIQRPRFDGIEELVLENFIRMYSNFEEDFHLVPKGNLIEIHYEDLVSNPIEVLQSTYVRLELGEFGPARSAVENYSQTASRHKVNQYEISPETRDVIHERWGGYLKKYGYC